MNKRFHVALWAAQIVLAVVFAMTGAMKTFLPPAELFRMLPDLAGYPLPFVRFLGIAELAAAAGLILPALTRIAPFLTPLAASGVVVVMIGAFVFHVQAGHFAKLAARDRARRAGRFRCLGAIHTRARRAARDAGVTGTVRIFAKARFTSCSAIPITAW